MPSPITGRLVQDVVRRSAAEWPDKVALVCDDQRLTFAQLDIMSDRLANALHKNGVARGERVLISLPNCVEAVVALFGTAKANGVFTLIDPQTHFERLVYIATDCAATAIVVPGQADLIAKLTARLPSLRLVVVVGEWDGQEDQSGPPVLTIAQILATYPPEPPPVQSIDVDLAYLIYTSGSTGEPKGVMITHRSSLFAVDIDSENLGLHSDDVVLDVMPLSFGYGFHQVPRAFRVGARLVLEKSFVFPNQALARIEAERVTGFPCIPTIVAHLLQSDLDRYDLSSLRYFNSMGAALAPSLIRRVRERFPNVALYSMYSQTEACNALGLDPAEIDRRPASVGKPLPGTEAWLVDENGDRLGAGEIGELVVAGGHVRSGYWNAPHLSAQKFRPGKLPDQLVAYTGDMFRMDEEGFFYFVGRNDEVVKTAGRKVAPLEVEDVLYRVEGVVEAAVVAVPDPIQGHVLKAFVVVNDSRDPRLTETGLLRHCARSLERFMVPRTIELRAHLPKTATGKIRKIDLI